MIRTLTKELLDDIETDWYAHFNNATANKFSGQYRQMLGAASSALSSNRNSQVGLDCYYILRDYEDKESLALLQVIKVAQNSDREYWKVLAMRSHPRLDSRNILDLKDHIARHTDVKALVANLFAACIFLVNDDTINADSVKVLGNKQIDSSFFDALEKTLNVDAVKNKLVEVNQGVEVTTHNRWLQIDSI